jgi:hypothetical protein
MPRAFQIVIEPWPPYRDEFYHCRVNDIKKSKSPPGLQVTIEQLHPDYRGRQHQFVLPLPCRPDGFSAGFLKACGYSTVVGTEITPKECIGREVLVRFRTTRDNVDVVDFAQPDQHEQRKEE